ncbi:hypothetical protein [Stieleria varia]|uniref:Uncharacterized protein n=1 Tax=Stieleria varia TaxID=2528005 RepID=A0A5C6B4K8_9BACT|nr:hypothetical protein [Stieleria varia]TWU06411.1 hypothetical protein Pla52n_21320 [Stieleria varia]
MQIYRLRPISDDPRFEGFGWDLPGITNENGRTYDFTHFYPTTSRFAVPRLAKRWDKPTFTFQENVNPFNDFPCCDFHVPVFSRRAVEAVRDLLEPHGELLPVDSKFGLYYAFQTTTLAPGILDTKKTSGIRLDDNPNYFYDISQYHFYKSKLKSQKAAIFRIPEHPSRVLTGDKFRSRVESNKLLGFFFDPIWSDDGCVDRAKTKTNQKQFEKSQSKTLVLHCQLAGESPTNSERKKIAMLRDTIADSIILSTPDEPFVGGLAGEETESGWIRILMPCPQPDKLLKVVLPLFQAFTWKGEKKLSKRNVPYWDDSADDVWIMQ